MKWIWRIYLGAAFVGFCWGVIEGYEWGADPLGGYIQNIWGLGE